MTATTLDHAGIRSHGGIKSSELGGKLRESVLPDGFRKRTLLESAGARPSKAEQFRSHGHHNGSAIKNAAAIGAVVLLAGLGIKEGYDALTAPVVEKPTPVVAGEIVRVLRPHVVDVEWSETTGTSNRHVIHNYRQQNLAFTDNLAREVLFPLGPAIDQHEHMLATGFAWGQPNTANLIKHGELVQIARVEQFGRRAGTRVTAVMPVKAASTSRTY